MPDRLTPEQRHRCMQSIHGRSTGPEMIVRRFLHAHGYRYRLNHDRLPGHPDIVLRQYRVCIFVNGCFWHGHEGCRYYVLPKTNTDFWQKKVARNIERDKDVRRKLSLMGWRCITIWECQLKPAVRGATLQSLLLTLSKALLQDLGHRSDIKGASANAR